MKPAAKTQVALTKEFPVSSGSQHRKKEVLNVYGQWVPVEKSSKETTDDDDDVFPDVCTQVRIVPLHIYSALPSLHSSFGFYGSQVTVKHYPTDPAQRAGRNFILLKKILQITTTGILTEHSLFCVQ